MKCSNCNSKIIYYYVCLLCGNKLCNSSKCVCSTGFGKKEYSLIGHSKKCGGGNVFFISGESSQIIYCFKRTFFYSGIYLYVNSSGEYPNNSNVSIKNDYVLNQVELDKSIQLYIDIKKRKKGYKINSIN